jgi:hypothetical protein
VGANHVSGVRNLGLRPDGSMGGTSTHLAETRDDFSYLTMVPAYCVASLVALELENSIGEQLAFLESVKTGLIEASNRTAIPERPPRSR